MNILVTGATGQLGSEIRALNEQNPPVHNFLYTNEEQVDITVKEDIKKYVEEHQVRCIINCAAYTDVDGAEEEHETAYLLNDTAPGYLAEIATLNNIPLIHVSTDYVFNGKHYLPYKESDPTSPDSIYGKSKLEGEKKIRDKKAGIIIRTSWLYSSYGKNFVKTITRLAREREELKVIYDQIGCPTYARDLAQTILQIIDSGADLKTGEVYHYSNEGVCSWYDFAKEITTLQDIKCKIHAIESKDFPQKAKRPHYSVFNKEKIKNDFTKIHVPYWKDSLNEMLKKLNS